MYGISLFGNEIVPKLNKLCCYVFCMLWSRDICFSLAIDLGINLNRNEVIVLDSSFF